MQYGQYEYRKSGCRSQTEATEAFADWLQQDVDMIPEGQGLRQHYHVVIQIEGTAAEDGMTDLCQSRDISASRMANQRDKQALYETYKERMHTDVNNEAASRWQTNAHRTMEAPDSPDIQATGNGHKQSRKAAATGLHRTGNSLPSLHTSTKKAWKDTQEAKMRRKTAALAARGKQNQKDGQGAS